MHGQVNGRILQPTAVVNEAYLRLVSGPNIWDNRAHFFGAAARAMRQVLIAEAERRSAQKREGGLTRVTFHDLNVATEAPDIDLLALEEAMTALGHVDERFTRVVELRYFAGCNLPEIAELTGRSLATVKRDWAYRTRVAVRAHDRLIQPGRRAVWHDGGTVMGDEHHDHAREQELFHACLELSPAERDAYLAETCGGDRLLGARVGRLLAAHAQAEQVTLSPSLHSLITGDVTDRIGPYRLVRVLGEGGMGTVYEAEQLEPVRRRVALKIVKLGMDTREVVARFMTERQALAAMDHPFVAKVFDAGQTAAGRPYFVMELVEGVPLLDYCDTHRLSVKERVELFMLDLPGRPARAPEGCRAPRSEAVERPGDRERAEPGAEDHRLWHCQGDRAATCPAGVGRIHTRRSAVGNTGLHEPGAGRVRPDGYRHANGRVFPRRDPVRVAGRVPAGRSSGDRLRGISRRSLAKGELKISRPSARVCSLPDSAAIAAAQFDTPAGLKRQLEGDLDWIVMKSLEVDRGRRYETALALAEDLQRYMREKPVSARPPTMSYQFRKFVRRHRVQVVAASVAAVALLVGTIAAAVGMVRATRAEATAREEAATSRQVSDFLVRLFTLSNPDEAPGSRRPCASCWSAAPAPLKRT